MLEHTKKHHTDKTTLFFEEPKENEREAITILKALSFKNTVRKTTSISWRDAFPEFTSNEPGTCLVAARHKKNLTQATLSDFSGIPRLHISEMESGERPIDQETAKKISVALDIDYRIFL